MFQLSPRHHPAKYGALIAYRSSKLHRFGEPVRFLARSRVLGSAIKVMNELSAYIRTKGK